MEYRLLGRSGCVVATLALGTNSLRRLQVEMIDLYQVHAFDPLTPIEETLQFFDDATRQGKVHYVGLSNFTGWQVQKTLAISDALHFARPLTLQQQYNLLARENEWEVIPSCQAEGLGTLPWSPLGGGWLAGKYQRDEQPTGANRLGEGKRNGVEVFVKRNPAQPTWDVISALEEVAKARSTSLAQVALHVTGPSGAVVARRPAGRHLGDPGRPYHRAARRRPGQHRDAPEPGRDRAFGQRGRTRHASPISSTVDGVSPLVAPTPTLSNATIRRVRASASMSAGSQLSRFPRKCWSSTRGPRPKSR
ncbi:MAG TPA: aldo/keto reductase [Acidimicrobiales bacterium]|nr:aldo/keto reductase [Acidimicrobiales bacterium]